MSEQYEEYLRTHKQSVRKAYSWIFENLFEDLIDLNINFSMLHNLIDFQHDASKTDFEEYDAYDRYFYGNNRSAEVVNDYNYAWLYHLHKNPHHWQHWVLINDDEKEGTVALKMPDHYVIEMICDWWSFSWTKGNLFEIFDWYNDHKNRMILHPETRQTVELLLTKIKERLGDASNETAETNN